MKFSSKWVKKTFKQYKFAISLTLVLTIAIVLLLTAVVAQQALLLTKSTAKITLEDQKLAISFNIDPNERSGFESFSQTLAVDNQWLEGISMTINQDTEQKLKSYLPREIKIQASADKLSFNSGKLSMFSARQLSSALPSKDGQVSIYQQDGVWQIVITDIAAVVQQATASGQLKLTAGVFEQFWPVLSKFATIRAEIGSDSLRGTLILK